MKYLSSDRLVTGERVEERKSFLKIRAPVPLECNIFLDTIEVDRGLREVRPLFSKVGASDGGDDLFTENGQRTMLEGKE